MIGVCVLVQNRFLCARPNSTSSLKTAFAGCSSSISTGRPASLALAAFKQSGCSSAQARGLGQQQLRAGRRQFSRAAEAAAKREEQQESNGVFDGVLTWMRTRPFTAQIAIATVKTSLADLMVQHYVEKRDQIDWRRNALFVGFGAIYLGIFQWFVYVRAFSKIFRGMNEFCNQSLRDKLRNRQGLKSLAGQIGLDFVFIQPFIYFPTFYCFKGIVEPTPDMSITESAFLKWKTNFWQDNLGMCGFWLPADLIIYSVPLWMRLPLNHAISFAWCCILSLFRGGDDEEEEQPSK